MCIWHCASTGATFRFPLMRTCRALGQFPFKAEEILEKVVTPFRWRRCPGSFKPTRNGIYTVAAAKSISPAEALLLNVGGGRFSLNIFCRIGCTVRFAEGVSPGNERNRFFVVHGHTSKGLPNVARCGNGIRYSVWTLWIYVYQP